MKFNLRNRPMGAEPFDAGIFEADVKEWFNGFEKELHQKLANMANEKTTWHPAEKHGRIVLIKEILGE